MVSSMQRGAPWRAGRRLSDPQALKFASGAALMVIASLYATLLIANASYAVGGTDSWGYVGTARLFTEGRATMRIEALDRLDLPDRQGGLFRPLGFVQGAGGGYGLPLYPPGFPVHLAIAALIGGWSTAPFLVSPLAAVAGVLLMYALGRELGLPPPYAVAASAIFALLPVYLFIAVQAMSDVVATVWCMVAIWAALRSERSHGWAIVSGVAFGVAVAVRPTNALLLVALVFALKPAVGIYTRFIAGGIPVGIALLTYNHAVFGGPFRHGYGSQGMWRDMALGYFPARFRHYVYWLSAMLTPFVPLGWLLVLADRSTIWRKRIMLWMWFLPFFVWYCFFRHYADWWWTRFLLPGIPALVLAALLTCRAGVRAVGHRAQRLAAAVAVVLVLAAGANGYRMATSFGVFDVDEGQSIFPRAAAWADERPPPRSIVLSMQLSGTLMWHTDRLIARWDLMNPEVFEALRQHTESRGYRWYALLFPFEERDRWSERAPGDWKLVATLDSVTLWQLEPQFAAGGRRLTGPDERQ